MSLPIKILSVSLLFSMPLLAVPATAPGEWKQVHADEIARWQSERGAKDGVAFDAKARSVTFLVEATGVSTVDPVEFFLIGPLSDRAYESFAVSTASPSAIAAALEKAGIKRGIPVSAADSRFWPQGERVDISIRALNAKEKTPLKEVLAVKVGENPQGSRELSFVYTGGERDAAGALVAQTNMPSAILALYSHPPSLLQLDDTLDQTSAYGVFHARKQYKPGELFEVTVSRCEKPEVAVKDVSISNNSDLASILNGLRECAKTSAVYARLSFADDITLDKAVNTAKAFSLVDGAGIRMNGSARGQFYYRAFTPDPNWQRREGRIFQPFEVHISPSGQHTFVYVEEDYSGEGIDPVLKPRSTPFTKWTELPKLIAATKADKVKVLFIYASPETVIGKLMPVLSVASPRISTFYIFADSEKSQIQKNKND